MAPTVVSQITVVGPPKKIENDSLDVTISKLEERLLHLRIGEDDSLEYLQMEIEMIRLKVENERRKTEEKILKYHEEKHERKLLHEDKKSLFTYSLWIILGFWAYAVIKALPEGAHEMCLHFADSIIKMAFQDQSSQTQPNRWWSFNIVNTISEPGKQLVGYALYVVLIIFFLYLLVQLISGKSMQSLWIVGIIGFFITPLHVKASVAYGIIRTALCIIIQQFVVNSYFHFSRKYHESHFAHSFLFPMRYSVLLVALFLGYLNAVTWSYGYTLIEQEYIVFQFQSLIFSLDKFYTPPGK